MIGNKKAFVSPETKALILCAYCLLYTSLGAYYDKKIFESDPFAKLDQVGVGQLMEMAVKNGKATRDVYKRQPLIRFCLPWKGRWVAEGKPEAVSYTHLDVYKRQMLSLPWAPTSVWSISPSLPTSAPIRLAATNLKPPRPVSYTHLDVYKRQDFITALNMYGGACLRYTILYVKFWASSLKYRSTK